MNKQCDRTVYKGTKGDVAKENKREAEIRDFLETKTWRESV